MSRGAEQRRSLRDLARLHGVQAQFRAVDGTRPRADDQVLVAVLRSLGVPVECLGDAEDLVRAQHASRARRLIEPVLVHRAGLVSRHRVTLASRLAAQDAWIEVCQEDGSSQRRRLSELAGGSPRAEEVDGQRVVHHQLRLGPPLALPPGYHRLRLEAPGASGEALVICAPRRCPQPPRSWGISAPLHALRSEGDWGVGSYGDLAALASWAQGLGAGFVGTLPLFAAFLEGPLREPSPYLPASRLGYNELYVDLQSLPELAYSSEVRAALEQSDPSRSLTALGDQELSDHAASMAAKRPVLQAAAAAAWDTPRRRQALESWLSQRPEMAAYARFRGAAHHLGDLRALRALTPGEVPDDVVDPEAEQYHRYVQWVADGQLAELSQRAQLYLDLPVGVHPAGFDPWWQPGAFVAGATGGAPPDDFFSAGQNWGFNPLHPESIRTQHYRYPIAVLRAAMRHAGVLRVDHIMGLHRLYFVPRGCEARQGAYVRYHADELHAVVVLEAARAGVAVVGEDLGTVPSAVRQAMARDGMLRSSVFQFEASAQDPLPRTPQGAVASLGTHDLWPFAGFLEGADIEEQRHRGLLEPAAADRLARRRAGLRRGLQEALAVHSTGGVMEGCTLHLAQSPSVAVMVDAADLLGERQPQNRPGITTAQGSFRRRFPHTLAHLMGDQGVRRLLAALDAARRGSPARRLENERTAAPETRRPGEGGTARQGRVPKEDKGGRRLPSHQ